MSDPVPIHDGAFERSKNKHPKIAKQEICLQSHTCFLFCTERRGAPHMAQELCIFPYAIAFNSMNAGRDNRLFHFAEERSIIPGPIKTLARLEQFSI
jgi:hypothetical protein